jgi:hypothetical protein
LLEETDNQVEDLMSGNAKFRCILLTLIVLFFLTASATAETPNKTSSIVITFPYELINTDNSDETVSVEKMDN